MSKVLRSLFLAVLLLLCVGCDKTPINGKLDGMWQLMTIQTPDGTRDMKQNQAYISIQLHLAEWWTPNLSWDTYHYFSHFEHRADSLVFFDLCRASAHTVTGSDDVPLTARQMHEGALDHWGVHTLHTRYRVVKLTAKHLTLEKEDTVYAFRKF